MKETLNVMELVDALEKMAREQGDRWNEMLNDSVILDPRILTTQGKEIGIRLAIQEIFKLAKS
jgi:hypothetical protein